MIKFLLVLFQRTPDSGIYGARSYTYHGYYNNGFALLGWASSTQLTINISAQLNMGLSDITSCKLDGVPQTVTNNRWSPGTGTACDGNDHIVEFTVKSGSVPSITYNVGSIVYINKTIFNK